jgi:hypothetical protein
LNTSSSRVIPVGPKGSRNKLGEAFIQALADDFERHGVEAIERVRIEKPEAYIKVIASLLPKDLNLNVSKYDHLTDEQLIVRLRMLTEQAAPFLGRLLDHDPAKSNQTRPFPAVRSRRQRARTVR